MEIGGVAAWSVGAPGRVACGVEAEVEPGALELVLVTGTIDWVTMQKQST